MSRVLKHPVALAPEWEINTLTLASYLPALVAWLTYGAFLHVRISRGWTGRPAACFALVAFLLVIFTYLGVSYLLPGLHSYAW